MARHGGRGSTKESLMRWIVRAAFLAAVAALSGCAGASPIRVLLAAIILPLLVFEPWLGEEAVRNAHVGGDLQGVEQFLMWFIVVPVTVIAGIVCVAATVLIKPVPSDPEI
jgi:hypothetical protein